MRLGITISAAVLLGFAGPAIVASGWGDNAGMEQALGLATFVLVVLALYLTVTRRIALDQADQTAKLANDARSILEGGRAAYITLGPAAEFFCSDRLREWIGLSFIPASLEDFRAKNGGDGIVSGDLDELIGHIEALANEGTSFLCRLRVAQQERILEATGRQVGLYGDAGFQILWFTDVSGEFAALAEQDTRLGVLDKEKHQLVQMLDAAPLPMWLRDKEQRLVQVNNAYVQAVEQTSRKDVTQKGIELLSSTLSTSGSEAGERQEGVHYTVVAGERRALNVVHVPVDRGAGAAIAGYAFDVTELQELKTEMDKVLSAHADTLNSLSSPVAIFAADATLQFYNSAFARLWQLPEDWLATAPTHDELLETLRENRRLPEQADFRAWKRQQLDQYRNALEPIEEMWHLPDERAIRAVTQPHPMGGLLLIYEDVTDRLALERSYNTLIAVQRETLENLIEAVAVFGSDGELQLYNASFAASWNVGEEFLATRPHAAEVLAASPTMCPITMTPDAWKDAFLGHIAERKARVGRLQRSGDLVFDYSIVPLPDGGALLTLQDVSDTVRIQSALRERAEALEAADRLKSEFVANVSYELRTPLNSIIGFSEMLDADYFGKLNEKQKEYVEGIIASSTTLKTLIDDILDLAVIEAGAMELELSEVPISKLVESVVTMASEQAWKRSVQVRAENVTSGIVIQGDRRRLQQALFNLVTNAVMTVEENSTVVVQAALEGDIARISVTDAERAVDEKADDAIGDFGTGPAARRQKNMGLGLALVRSFIELHGGTVTRKYSDAEGAMIICAIPCNPPSGTKADSPEGEVADVAVATEV